MSEHRGLLCIHTYINVYATSQTHIYIYIYMYIYVYIYMSIPCHLPSPMCVHVCLLQCGVVVLHGNMRVLQCGASVLQCVAVCCSVSQCVAVCCGVWKCVAVF